MMGWLAAYSWYRVFEYLFSSKKSSVINDGLTLEIDTGIGFNDYKDLVNLNQ
jgi:hypothetical protein